MGRKRILVPWFINDHTTCGGPLSYRTKNWSWLKVGYTINGEAVLKVVCVSVCVCVCVCSIQKEREKW